MNFGLKKLYINGQLIDSSNGDTFDVVCPGDEKKIANIAWATAEDTNKALWSAQAGFEYWSALSTDDRKAWINKLRDKIIDDQKLLRESIMYEMGKVWTGTEEDLTSLTNSLAYYADEVEKRETEKLVDKEGTHKHNMVPKPIGVVVAFLAYNFPLLNLGFKLGPALASGCSIIIKPSEFSPLSAYIIGEICASIDFPKGVINILCGDVEHVGKVLCESRIPKLITLIGSTNTAKKLMIQGSHSSLKRYSMECGGNAPFIVFPDADLDTAIAHGAALKIGNAGQICVAPNRFFIHTDIIDQFLKGMQKKFEGVNVGFGLEANPDMGPLANKQSIGKISKIVSAAMNQGGELLFGGKPLDRSGYYYEPTLIHLKNKEAEVLQDEVFGPVAIVVSFSTKEEVLELSNNTSAGLASYVYTKDDAKIQFFIDQLEFGEIHVNGFKFDIYLPHGGIKDSGSGVDCSPLALDEYFIQKRVTQLI